MHLLRGLKKTFLRIILVVAVIAVLNFIGLRLYHFMTDLEILPSFVFVAEGITMITFGLLGIDPDDILLSRVGWLGYVVVGVRNVEEEVKKGHPWQLKLWMQFVIIGLILLIIGLLLFASS